MAEVLVVDPGELGELLATLLGQYGMVAARARSGEEALEQALVDTPRVVIVEQELPDASGVDLAELLRAELGAKVILTYAQSIVTQGDDALLGRIGAMDASFARPFRSLTLVEAASRLLGRELRKGDDAGNTLRPLSSTEGAAITPLDDPSDELVLEEPVRTDPGTASTSNGPAPPLQERLGPAAGSAPTFTPGGLSDLWQRVKARRSSSPERRAPGGEGPLSPRLLADMLDAFHQSQTTGELWLQSGRARRVLLIRRGAVVGARSNIESEEMANLALRRGLLTPEGAAACRDDVLEARQRTIVEAVLARGLLSEPQLKALVEEHVRRVALASFTWPTGTMKVTLEGRAGKEPVPVRVPVGDLIVRSILLTESDEALAAAAPDNARFSPAADSGYGLEDLTLSGDEARVVIAMDGTKTIKDLVTLFAPVPSERTIRGLAAGLLCLHLVRFVGWGAAEARRISFF